jgi:hypothetical protein
LKLLKIKATPKASLYRHRGEAEVYHQHIRNLSAIKEVGDQHHVPALYP